VVKITSNFTANGNNITYSVVLKSWTYQITMKNFNAKDFFSSHNSLVENFSEKIFW